MRQVTEAAMERNGEGKGKVKGSLLLAEMAVRGGEGDGRGWGEEEKEGARGAAKRTGVMKPCREPPREAARGISKLPTGEGR